MKLTDRLGAIRRHIYRVEEFPRGPLEKRALINAAERGVSLAKKEGSGLAIKQAHTHLLDLRVGEKSIPRERVVFNRFRLPMPPRERM